MLEMVKTWAQLNNGNTDRMWAWLLNVVTAYRGEYEDQVYFNWLHGFYVRYDEDKGWFIYLGTTWKPLNPEQSDVDHYYVSLKRIKAALKCRDSVYMYGDVEKAREYAERLEVMTSAESYNDLIKNINAVHQIELQVTGESNE